MSIEIVTRAQWGARHDNGDLTLSGPGRGFYFHHTVTAAPPNDPAAEHRAIRAIEAIGEQRFGRGMSYNWLIPPSGRVYEGCSMHRRGAHTNGLNSVVRSISFVGNYENDHPTAAQLEAAAQLVAHCRKRGQVTGLVLGGHRDVKGTSCPGRFVYSQIPAVNQRAAAILTGNDGNVITIGNPITPTLPPAPKPTNPDGSLTIDEDGIRGRATIGRWQEVLGTPIDWEITPGRSTLIEADQRYLNSVVDGGHIRNLTGEASLRVDGDEGAKTIKVRQFLLFNWYAPAKLGRPADAQDFDGIDGVQTTTLHQYALNRSRTGSGRY